MLRFLTLKLTIFGEIDLMEIFFFLKSAAQIFIGLQDFLFKTQYVCLGNCLFSSSVEIPIDC